MNKIFTLFILFSHTVFSQNKMTEYYGFLNQSITEFNNKNFENSFKLLANINPVLFFPEDIDFSKTVFEIIKKTTINKKKYSRFITKFKKKDTNINYLFSENQLLNTGFQDKNNKLVNFIKPFDLPLYSIISKDKYNGLLRLKIESQEVVDELYSQSALITLKIFQEIKLPSRKESMLWNDDLSLALSHSLNSLPEDSVFVLLNELKEEVHSGNLYAYQYALLYDEMYIKFYQKSYYGAYFVHSISTVDNQFNLNLYTPIDQPETVNKRRKEIYLCNLEDWCLLKKINYDIDTN